MKYNLGLVGHPLIIEQTKDIINENFSNINICSIPIIHNTELDAVNKKINTHTLDGLLFIGKSLHHLFLSKYNIELPSRYIEKSKTEIYKVLLKASYVNGYNLRNISIDYVKFDFLYRLYNSLGINDFHKCNINIININDNDENLIDSILQQHINNYHANKSLCITYYTEIYLKLNSLGIPTAYIPIDEENIIKNIDALHLIKNTIVKNGQIVILITLSNLEEHFVIDNIEHSVLLEYNRIAEEVFWFAKKLKGSSIRVENKKYYIYCNSEDFERETEFLSKLDVLDAISEKQLFYASIGVGYGSNNEIASKHATIANIRSTNEKKNSAYVMFDESKIVGPLLASNSLMTNRESIFDLRLNRIARESSISINTIYKIDAYINHCNKKCLTSNDISTELNITQRSANRIISKLLESGFIKNLGNKSNGRKGRPIAVYEFLF